MRRIENRAPPPLLALVIAALMAASLLARPHPIMPSMLRTILAALCFAVAGVFGFPALSAFGKAQTTMDPVHIDNASKLVISGVYRVSRNPMYVGLSLLLVAWAVWLARPLSWIGPTAFVLFIDRFQIIPEERALVAKFGAAYSDYRRSVRRWL